MNHSGKFCAIALMFFFGSNLFGQGLYVEFNTGYNFGINGSTDFIDNTEYFVNYDNGFYSGKTESRNLSLGKGINFGGVIGFNFNRYFGAELGVNYLLGLSSKGEYKDVEVSGGASYIYESTSTFKGSSLQFVPGIVFNAGFENLNPYAGVGVVVAVNSFKYEYSETSTSPGSLDETTKFKGGISIGVNVRTGVLFQLGDNAFLFVEGTLNSMNYSPKKSKITEYKEDGIDMLSSLPTAEKETEYVKVDEWSSYDVYDPGSPSQEARFSIPFSSLGINIGIRVNLGNK